MNSNHPYRALIVDDEPAVRRLLARALGSEGFQCDLAADGTAAHQLVAVHKYHLVVTDLKMPNMHGHALATQLLTCAVRPTIVVYTGVIEPFLARDLLARGVDDIVFKPTDTRTLAIKARRLVEQRHGRDATRVEPAAAEAGPRTDSAKVSGDEPVSMSAMEERIQNLSRSLPISQAALDVYQMAIGGDWTIDQIAAAIQRDAALTIEVLRLANSTFYNPSGVAIVQLERAVVHVGQKRIGELALAVSVQSALACKALSWMDLQLVWERSLAGGVMAEALDYQCGREVDSSTLLGAIMYPLGRVAMATLFPEKYAAMVAQCQSGGQALRELETSQFPIETGAVLARLLESWGVPDAIYLPLKGLDEAHRSQLPEEIRQKADRIELATSLAQLAVGRWESWDWLALPVPARLKQLGVSHLDAFLAEARRDIQMLASFQVHSRGEQSAAPPAVGTRRMKVCEVAKDPFNTMGTLLRSMQMEPECCRPEELTVIDEPVIIQCCGATPAQVAELLPQVSSQAHLIVTTHEHQEQAARHGRVVCLPASYARLQEACLQMGC